MTTEIPVVIRAGYSLDLEYVLSCWEKHCPHPGRTSKEFMELVLEPVLARDGVSLRVAHVPDDRDAIVGFAVLQAASGELPPCLLHVYVRKAARRRGVARRLLADLDGAVDLVQLPSFTLPNRFRHNPNRWPAA